MLTRTDLVIDFSAELPCHDLLLKSTAKIVFRQQLA